MILLKTQISEKENFLEPSINHSPEMLLMLRLRKEIETFVEFDLKFCGEFLEIWWFDDQESWTHS